MRHDAIIIGGSFAGLSAAIYLARARRSVAVIDTGSPRNRFAEHSHGFFAHDGDEPRAMIGAARSQVAAYPTTTFVDQAAVRAAREDDGFGVELATGERVEGSRLVLAFGVADELPEIPGLAARWGRSVLHCPYCHGFEFSGRPLGVLYSSPLSAHQAMLIADWGPTTLYLDAAPEPDADTCDALRRRGVTIEPAPVKGLIGTGDALSEIELGDGRTRALEALYLRPVTRLNSGIASELGCDLEDGPAGPMIRTDSQKLTSVPGVYAAGDITRAMHNATFASGDGVMAGVALHASLIF